ncbi:MAG: hypothetical protein M0P69_10070 [Bacteroidales bacterium]|nr:hypothetical protein [Bacteroidales bacterium]
MNAVDKLLKMDAGKLKTPMKDITIKLAKLDNEEFVFPCKAIDPELIAEMQEDALEIVDGELDKIKMYNQKVFTVIEGCPDVFKNKDVMKHFGVPTPKELVPKIMLSGEIDELYGEINKLNGYNRKKQKDEVKN